MERGQPVRQRRTCDVTNLFALSRSKSGQDVRAPRLFRFGFGFFFAQDGFAREFDFVAFFADALD